MELSTKQQQIVSTPFSINTLIKGASGVGKSSVLLKKYSLLLSDRSISGSDVVFIVSDVLKKAILQNEFELISTRPRSINILTINELIYDYLKRVNLDLFQNTIDAKTKTGFLKSVMSKYDMPEFDFSLDYIADEINYIQSNICVNDNDALDALIAKELKIYLSTPRRATRKGLLSPREKEYIFQIYGDYLYKALNEDFFDEQTFYQSFLRLIYHHYENDERSLKFPVILIDDIQDFTKLQLDIIYYLYDDKAQNRLIMTTLDELKSKDRYHNYRNSSLFKIMTNIVTLEINYRNTRNIFNVLKSYLSNNELMKPTVNYKSAYNNNKNEHKSVLTYFYNKSTDEKREVFLDRLDLLVNIMKYRMNEILVVFFDMNNLFTIKEDCAVNNIQVFNIYEHVEQPDADAITLSYKEDVQNCEFKVVIMYDIDNGKCCTGPVNKIINITKNHADSISFYLAASCAKELLIINSSISEPSWLLLPSNIDFTQFVFEVGSQFQIKSSLNVYRISDFVAWIKDNLNKHYGYSNEDFSLASFFDLLIDVNYTKIGFKILDNNIDNDTIRNILKKGRELTHIVIFDSHHYLTFKNVNSDFLRVTDLPAK